MCAQLSLIRLSCSYEEALCPCLPQQKSWSCWTDDRAAGLYDVSMIFGNVWGRIARGWKMSKYSFQRWASDDYRPVETVRGPKEAIYVGSTGPVFAPYWSARLAVGCSKARTASARAALHPKGHLPKPDGTRTVPCYTGPNTQRTGRTHVTVASQEDDFVRTSHGPQTPMAPQVLRAGADPWVSCMRPKHYIFYD